MKYKQLAETVADASQYKFSALVDWIELRVHIERNQAGIATNGGTLKRLLGDLRVSYVCPVNPGDGGAATEFLVRIQVPNTFLHIQAVLDRLKSHRQLSRTPTVAAIEIAFDAYPKNAFDQVAIDQMTLRFMQTFLPPACGLRYFPRQKKGSFTHTSSLLLSRERRVTADATLYIGTNLVANHRNQDYVRNTLLDRHKQRCAENDPVTLKLRCASDVALDDVMWRVYRKETDEQFDEEGKRLPVTRLPAGQHRARAEVTLSGQILRDLKLITLNDLAAFDFAEIAKRKLLRFAQVTKKPYFADPVAHKLFIGKLGMNEQAPACVAGAFGRKDRRGRYLDVSKFLTLDAELNERLQKRLKRLNQEFLQGLVSAKNPPFL